MTFESYLNRSRKLFDAGELIDAMQIIKVALQLRPTDPDAYNLYLRIALQTADHDLPNVVEEFRLWFERHFDEAHQAALAPKLTIQQFIDFHPDGKMLVFDALVFRLTERPPDILRVSVAPERYEVHIMRLTPVPNSSTPGWVSLYKEQLTVPKPELVGKAFDALLQKGILIKTADTFKFYKET